MKTTQLILSSLFLLLFGVRADAATTYTVNASGGGNYTTIQACSSKAVAGDTCDVFTGSYSGWTQSASGGAGNPITFQAHAGNTVTLTSGVSLSSQSYIRLTGFRFSFSGTAVSGNGSTAHNIVDHNAGTVGSLFHISDGQGSNGSDNVISSNTVVASSAGNNVGIYLYGDRNLIDANDLQGFDGDCMDLGGTNVVVRNNRCHDLNGSTSGQHIDFIQVMGDGTAPTLSYSLIENNVEQNCTNDGGNCHFVIVRTCSGVGNCSLVADTIIARFNYVQNMNGSGFSLGGVGDNSPNAHLYNNTIATEAKAGENGDCGSFQNAANGVALNNICYNTTGGPWAPFAWFTTSSGDRGNGNLAFTTGFSGSWNSPYSSESTYSTLHNKNPLFANYPADGSLQAGSPMINAGVALTAVASGDSGSGTSLVVSDARFFQPGWAGTQGDWIRVGASTTAQIASINYSTNTLTLTAAITRSAGSPVYLSKNSSGISVLAGSLPTVGAYQAPGGGVATPTAPTNLRIVP